MFSKRLSDEGLPVMVLPCNTVKTKAFMNYINLRKKRAIVVEETKDTAVTGIPLSL